MNRATFGVQREAGRAIFRQAVVQYLAAANRQHISEVVKSWPGMTMKAAVTPLVMSDLGIAGVADISPIIAPASAFSTLVAHGITVSLAGVTAKTVPARIVNANDAGGFVAEGAAIPVTQSVFAAGPTISPCKLACITVFTRELSEHSVSDCQTIMASMMSEGATMVLDSTSLGNGAAVAGVSPAGILNGVSVAGTATSNTQGAHLALAKDIEILMGALATAGAGVSPIFVCSPAQAASMKLLVGPRFDYPIVASVGVANGTLIAIEGDEFCQRFFRRAGIRHQHASGAAYGQSSVGVLDGRHYRGPGALALSADMIAVKMIMRVGWGMRAAGHVQYITGVNW